MLIDLAMDYTDDDTHLVDLDSLAYRRDELHGEREDYEAEGERLPEEEDRELAMLTAFLAAADRHGVDRHSGTAVVDARFEDHVRYEAEQEYGISADGLGPYVDWESYAKDQRGNYAELELDGQTVLVK